MRDIAFFVGLTSMIGLGAGCGGPDCQDTCNKLYQSEQCDRTSDERRDDRLNACNDACEQALEIPGEQGDYDPYDFLDNNSEIELENDKQAAVWMECIDTLTCDNIDQGQCRPIFD
ncbi:MAG: hypothetical protein AAFV53_24040 [Myxococcota bacterium]